MLIHFFYLAQIFLLTNNDTNGETLIIYLSIANFIGFFYTKHSINKIGFRLSLEKVSEGYKILYKYKIFFISRLFASIYTLLPSPILLKLGIPNQPSYAGGEQIYKGIQSLLASIIQSLFPHLNKEKDDNFFYIFFLISLIILTALIIVINFFKFEIINFLLGEKFIHIENIIEYFFYLIIINYIGSMFGYPAFSLINKIYLVNISLILGGCLFLILLFINFLFMEITILKMIEILLITEISVMLFRILIFIYEKKKYKI